MHPAALFEELFTLFVMAFALGMDAFSVGLGMGMLDLRLKRILKIGFVIGLFHMVMPLFGMLIGDYLSDYFGAMAALLGGILLLLLGAQMIYSS
ncbi:MAG TPA: manganese efflux pump, partial [Bacillales bacterium]|nr:manganese efflux pump [Bacillales bacterium]